MDKQVAGGWALMSFWVVLNDISVSLFDASITTLFMASAGSLLTYAYTLDGQKPLPPKRKYFLAAANTAFATAAVVVLPKWLGWEWVGESMKGSLALLFAASARFVVPILFGLSKEILKKWFRLEQYNTSASVVAEDSSIEGKDKDV